MYHDINDILMETAQAYTARLLSYVEGEKPLKVLSSTPKRIKKLIKGLKKKSLYIKPAPGKWSIAEITAHLAETELVMGWRYRSIAEKNEVRIQSFEQDDWAVNSKYGESDFSAMMELFSVLRKANLNFVAGLPKGKLENFGIHDQRGKETIAHIVRLEAGHDINHLRQIEALVSSFTKKKK